MFRKNFSWVSIVSLLLFIVLVFSACSKAEKNTASESFTAASGGMYIENVISPVGCEGTPVDVWIGGNGELEVLSKIFNPQLSIESWVLYSGNTGSDILTLKEQRLFEDYENGYKEYWAGAESSEMWLVKNACILYDRGYFIQVSKYISSSGSSEFDYAIINRSGQTETLNPDLIDFLEGSKISNIKALSNNRIFVEFEETRQDGANAAVLDIDSGKEIIILNDSAGDNWFLWNEAIVYKDRNETVYAKDINNGKDVEAPDFTSNEDYAMRAFKSMYTYTFISPDGKLISANKDGLFEYGSAGTREIEAFKTEFYRLSSSLYTPYSLHLLPNNTFLSLFGEKDGVLNICIYLHDVNASSEITEEIEVYSLYEQIDIPYIIEECKYVYPQLKINYSFALPSFDEYQLSGSRRNEQTIKEQDAIKTLNARLLNGKGPDILILDGLPLQSLIENGLLEDLTAIGSDEKLISKITSSVSGEALPIYALPTRFSLPLLVGSEDNINKLQDNDYFYEEFSSGGNLANDTLLLACPTTAELVFNLYAVNQPTLFPDYTDLKSILQFLETAASIDNATKPMEGSAVIFQSDTDNPKAQGLVTTASFIAYMDGRSQMAMGIVNSFKTLDNASDTMFFRGHFADGGKRHGENHIADYFPAMQAPVFLPKQIAGVYSQSENKQAAFNFINIMLSHNGQKIDLGYGFPVRRETLDKQIREYNSPPATYLIAAGYQNISFDIYDILENAQTPVIVNRFLQGSILTAYEQYSYGSISIDDAAAQVEADTLLFFAEK